MEDHVAATRIAELKRSIRILNRTITKLMKRADWLTSLDEDEDVDEVEKEVRSLKMGQENVKNLLKKLMKESDLAVDVLLKRIKEIEEEVYPLNSRLIDLTIKIMTEKSNIEVEAIKKGAIELGIKISGLLVDVMIVVSERNVRRRMEFQGFRISLDSDSGEDAPAINKFVAVIGITEGKLTSMGKPKLPESSSAAGSSDCNLKETDSDGPKITKILDTLRPEILNLNLLMIDYSQAESDVSSLKNDLKECEKNLKTTEKEVKKLWAGYSSLLYELKDLKNLKEAMEGKINEIWKGKSGEETE